MSDKQVFHTTLFKDDEKCSTNHALRVVNGARKIGLDGGYIEYIQQMMAGAIDFKVDAPEEQSFLEITRQREFTFAEVQDGSNKETFLCVLKGVVLEYPAMGPVVDKRLSGYDITLEVAKEWANATEENCESIESLEDEQKVYVNCVLYNLFAGGLPVLTIVGKVEQEYEWSIESFDW